MKGCDSVVIGIGYFFKILHEKVTVFVFRQLRLAESQLSTFILFPRTYIVNLVTHAIWITATSALVSAICISGPFGPSSFFFFTCLYFILSVSSQVSLAIYLHVQLFFFLIHYADLFLS